MRRWGSCREKKSFWPPGWSSEPKAGSAGRTGGSVERSGGSAGRSGGSERVTYDIYHLSWKEWAVYEGEGIAVCGAAAYLFYRNMAAFFLFLPVGILYPIYKRRSLRERRKEELRMQFKEAILMLASSLGAGFSVENAFAECCGELEELYGKEGMITGEFDYIARQLRMNRTVEELLTDFALRSGLEEIENFAEIFAVSKRSRGELVSVVNHVAHVIGDKIQVKEEIITLTAEKKFEQGIMNLMPFFIVLYIDLSSPGFFTQMYETAAGRVVMTACLAVYGAACLISERIMRIEV